MIFFLIVPSVMIVSIFLVHGVMSRLGFRIHYGALAMCAVLSILADLGAVALSDNPDKWYFIKLGIIILVAAATVTLINKFLVEREIAEEMDFSEQVRREYHGGKLIKLDEPDEENISEEVAEESAKKIDLEESKLVEEVEKKSEPVEEVEKVSELVEGVGKVSEPVEVVEKISEVEEIKKVGESVEENFEVVSVEEKIKVNEKSEEVQKIESVEPQKISETKSDEKIKLESKPAEIPKVEQKEKFESEKNIDVQKKVEPARIEIDEPVENSLETLDDILDYAYSEKTQGNVLQAVAAYKKALERYKNDEYAPFVAIDLGNIYKEQASYTKAIKTYEDALDLPTVKRNAATLKEFKNNLAYLKIVQSVLLRHQALSTPFSQISREYLQEIETEFQAAQLKSAQSRAGV